VAKNYLVCDEVHQLIIEMPLIFQALGLQEYIPDVAVLYSVDWLLGMFRTAVNIWGDACACVIVDTWATRYAKNHPTLPTVVSFG
jgi:Na+/H+-dicarboxylate symporter